MTKDLSYPQGGMATLDAIWGAAGKLSRDWGDHGYRMSIEGTYGTPEYPYLFGCTHSDGSVFWIVTDRYGNARQAERERDGTITLVNETIHA